jgi:hypothetical protein
LLTPTGDHLGAYSRIHHQVPKGKGGKSPNKKTILSNPTRQNGRNNYQNNYQITCLQSRKVTCRDFLYGLAALPVDAHQV